MTQMTRISSRLYLVAVAGAALLFSNNALAWSLKEVAAPYKGTTITVVALQRPTFKAMKELTHRFEETTGINVKFATLPYESTLRTVTLNFVSHSNQFDVIVSDDIWATTFASAGWVVPLKHFFKDEKALVNPNLDLGDFFPIWLARYTIHGKLYGLPFAPYAGLLFFNKEMLRKHGFEDPPETWKELRKYARKITNKDKGIYGYVLQSARGETQTCDAFTRFLWPWGGKFLDVSERDIVVNSPQAVQGLKFRRSLVKMMPEGIVSDNHSAVVQALIQGDAAMITEWSSFYTTIKQSDIGDKIGVTVEPKGPKGRIAAFGGFAYMVSSQVPEDRRNASYLFVQWLTSKRMARPLIKHGAVSARVSAVTDPQVQAENPNFKPMAKSWRKYTVPNWRPQLRCYPKFSRIVSTYGSTMEMKFLPVEPTLDKLENKLTHYMKASNCWKTANQPAQYISRYKNMESDYLSRYGIEGSNTR